MVIKNVNLETVVGITSTIPQNIYPEVAFSGKSNVGKSSLINALMNRKSYARISSKPGKTQTINYYNINDEIFLVDLPGYGYTKIAESVKIKWGEMIERYLGQSKQLKAVFLLVDIRHKPSENDRNMYNWILDNGFEPIVIATKKDKIKRSQLQKQIKLIKETLDVVQGTKVIPFSSQTKDGRDEIYEIMDSMIVRE
jgi:GTP-binding protein